MIYFIDGRGGLIKIGYTAKLNQRLADFRTTLPNLVLIGTMEGTRGHERTIHDCLANHRREREWFNDCPEVRSFIAKAISEGVREWKSGRRRNFEPSMWDHRADRLCEIICADRPKSEFALIEKELTIPSGVLWALGIGSLARFPLGNILRSWPPPASPYAGSANALIARMPSSLTLSAKRPTPLIGHCKLSISAPLFARLALFWERVKRALRRKNGGLK